MRRLDPLLLILINVLAFCYGNSESNVLVLDSSNFNEAVKSHSFIVVDFYAPWCGHCKRLAPEYEKAAAMLKSHDPPIILATVDADKRKNKALASQYDVRGFPTLKIIENRGSIVRDYKGPRDAEGIVAYLKKQAGKPSNEITSAEQGKKLVEETDFLVVGLFSSYDSEEFTNFTLLASELRSDYVFHHTLDVSFLPERAESVDKPSICVFKTFEEGFNNLKDFNIEAVKKFLDDVSIPSTVLLNKDPVQKKFVSKIVSNRDTPKIFLFVGTNDENVKGVTETYKNLAKQYKGRGTRFVIADPEEGKNALKYFGLRKDKLPSLVIHDKNDQKHILEEAQAGKLEIWLNEFFEGNALKLQSSEKDEALMTTDNIEALMWKLLKNGHVFVEALLVVVIVYLLLQKSYQPEKRPLTNQEIDQLCDEWEPEPLHPPLTNDMEAEVPVLESAAGPRTIVNGEEVINLATANYLGLIGNKRIVEACTSTLEKYGVGACGPRGFYGTIDVHLDCEAKIAKFMGTTDSILYSYGLATAASTIPAFCKRGDLLLVDEGVNWGIQNGLYLSRSTVKLFKHNDMTSLISLLEETMKEDRKQKKALNRRFIVVEAIYQNSGQMAPLPELIRLKEKYQFRLFVDESNSIGVLGDTGRGLTEHYKVPVGKVDIITAAMGHALASVGGFCTGSLKVVDHQRLSGAGYCFSASLPPYVATASITAFCILEEDPKLLVKLHNNVRILREALSRIPGMVITSHEKSPVVFLQLKQTLGSFKEDHKVLQMIADQMLSKESVMLAVTKRSMLDKCKLSAALKLAVSAAHTEADLLSAASSLRKIAASFIEAESNGQYEFVS